MVWLCEGWALSPASPKPQCLNPRIWRIKWTRTWKMTWTLGFTGMYRVYVGNRVYDLPLVTEGMDPYSSPFLIPDIEARYRSVTYSLVVCHGPCILLLEVMGFFWEPLGSTGETPHLYKSTLPSCEWLQKLVSMFSTHSLHASQR